MVKVSDVIADFLKQQNITTIFGIIGSANAHIFDSIHTLGFTKIISVHNEQAAILAMGAYFRSSGKLSASIVTAGGGATNAITGVASNWADSIPGIIFSGQENAKYIQEHSNLRMYGTQGFNITKMVEGVTKWQKVILEPKNTQRILEDALYITTEGRPGPVWIDVPQDIQGSKTELSKWNFIPKPKYDVNVDYILNSIKESKKPLILGGHGVRLAGAKEEFNKFVNLTQIPTTLSWSGIDLLADNNPNFYGRWGIYGQRAANFICQNADLVIVLGSRLALPQVGYDFTQFTRNAKIIVIDVDELEATKHPVDKHILADCKDVLLALLNSNIEHTPTPSWISYCSVLKNKYPWYNKEIHTNPGYINSYMFMDKISVLLEENHIITTDMGTALLSGHQGLKLKKDQTMFTSLGLGEMGYGLPGAIGAQLANPNKPVLCLNCDGGIMMNLQELHTIIGNKLPIKIVIFNNDGYLMIKHTQKVMLNGRYTSINEDTGVSTPNFSKLMPSFGYDYSSLREGDDFDTTINNFLKTPGAGVLEVFQDPEQHFLPKVKGVLKEDGTFLAPPLEEMSPLLPLNKLKENMNIPLSYKSKQIKRK